MDALITVLALGFIAAIVAFGPALAVTAVVWMASAIVALCGLAVAGLVAALVVLWALGAVRVPVETASKESPQ